MNKPLEIEVTYTANIARVKLRGRLDTPGVDRVEAKLNSAVVPEGRNTVVDLSEVSFIASMGSEERRVGKECLAVCRSRWSPYH